MNSLIAIGGVPATPALPSVRAFTPSDLPTQQLFMLTGVTRDAQGVALGGCTVDVFLTSTDQKMYSQVSDPTTGVYSIIVQAPPATFYVVAYLAGAPDVAGTTVNTLQGV